MLLQLWHVDSDCGMESSSLTRDQTDLSIGSRVLASGPPRKSLHLSELIHYIWVHMTMYGEGMEFYNVKIEETL